MGHEVFDVVVREQAGATSVMVNASFERENAGDVDCLPDSDARKVVHDDLGDRSQAADSMPDSDHEHFQILHLVKKLTQLCTESGWDELLVESTIPTADIQAQDDEGHCAG